MGFWQIYFALYGADGVVAPVVTADKVGTVVSEFRSRTAVAEFRSRTIVARKSR